MNQAVRPRMGKGAPFRSCRNLPLLEAATGKAATAGVERGGEPDDPPPQHPSKTQAITLRIRVTPRDVLRALLDSFNSPPLTFQKNAPWSCLPPAFPADAILSY